MVAYYNEQDYLADTLVSLARQTVPLSRLVLVDNGSTDRSTEIARDTLREFVDLDIVYLAEAKPGQINAITAGLGLVETPFVMFCDADTYYPPQYVSELERLFDQGGDSTVLVMAGDVQADAQSLDGRLKRLKTYLVGRVLARQCHTGNYGLAFRTEAVRRAGGYSEAIWPYVLQDHELPHRVFAYGCGRVGINHWCRTSDRRTDSGAVRWDLTERLMYHLVPYRFKNWYFYQFLAPRLAARKMSHHNLRDTRDWERSE